MKFIIVILIIGVLFFSLIQILPIAGENRDNSGFLASAASFLNDYLDVEKEIKGIISVVDKEDFKESIIYFNKKINIFDIKFFPHNQKTVFAASDRGLFVSRDEGLNWKSFSDKENKINAKTEVYKILFGSSGQAFLSVFQNNKGIIYQSQDDFLSLRKILEFTGAAANNFDIFENNLYIGLSDGKLILYSLDNQSFRILNNFNSGIIGLKVGTEGLIYLTLKDGGFYASKNSGQSFERMKFLDDFSGADKISDFSVNLNQPAEIYAATDYGLIRSQDSGMTWQVFKSLPTEEKTISILAIGESNEIFATDYDRIYKSRDKGKNWQILYPEIEGGREISIMAVKGEKIIVGSKE